MRRVREVRPLADGEKKVAQPVFRSTIPYDKVLISDGLGYNDREFTLPTRVPFSALFNVDASLGKYVIHAGDGYYGMSTLEDDKATLIHELTHVWQGEHWASSYWLNSAWNQALSDDAYSYDETRLLDWDEYNAEQQAKIVEEWYRGGMKPSPDEDFRFYYVQRHIWGMRMSPDWLQERRRIKPLPAGVLKEHFVYDLDGFLLPILAMRFRATDVAGFAARAKRVEAIFRSLRSEQAIGLLPRLAMRRSGDKVSEMFHGRLSTPTRIHLTYVLKERSLGRDM